MIAWTESPFGPTTGITAIPGGAADALYWLLMVTMGGGFPCAAAARATNTRQANRHDVRRSK
jgi:hypothetical protein